VTKEQVIDEIAKIAEYLALFGSEAFVFFNRFANGLPELLRQLQVKFIRKLNIPILSAMHVDSTLSSVTLVCPHHCARSITYQHSTLNSPPW
jgi:hypothetical protein